MEHCKIATIQMWLNSNKIINIQPHCSINTVTSWYYEVNQVINKGTLKHIAHCFIENSCTNDPLNVFRNEKDVVTYGHFYCNLDTFQNINGQITSHIIHHIKCNQYNIFADKKDNDDCNNGKTNVFGTAVYQIRKRCNIDDEIIGNVLLFDCGDEFVLEGRLHAHKHCFIRSDNKIELKGQCNIKFSRSNEQLTQDIFQKNHSKIFGYNYDTFTQLSFNKATPLLWIKSASLLTNGAIINDNGKIKSNPLLNCIIVFDIKENCVINDLNLSSNNKFYLLNTQNIEINSSAFNTNRFYVNTIDDIECKLNPNLNCIFKPQIENIQIESSSIDANELYINNVNVITSNKQTHINCRKTLIIFANEKVNLLMSKIKTMDDLSIININTPSLVMDNCTIEHLNNLCVTFNVQNDCNISHSNLSSNRSYLLNVQTINIISTIFTAKEFYINTMKETESKDNMNLCQIQNIQIEKSSINANKIVIHNIDAIECKNNTNINCYNTFKMQEVNQYKLMKNCTLSMQKNTDIDSNMFNECSIKTKDFFVEYMAEIYCSFQLFDVRCDNQIELNGKVFISKDCCKFKLNAIKRVLIGETCQFQSKSVYENSKFDNEDETSIRDNTESVTEFLMQKNLNDDLNGVCYICLWSDINIEIKGHIKGNKSLCVVNCNEEINISETSQSNLYCLFINCRKQINFKGSFDCKHGELGLCATKSLNIDLDNKNNINSWFSLFHTDDMYINGTIQSDKITLNATVCNIETQSLVANTLLAVIKEKLICSGTITVHEAGTFNCDNECILQNVNLITNYVKQEEDIYSRGRVDEKSEIKRKIIILNVKSVLLSINECEIIDEEGCDITFEVSNALTVSKSKLICKNGLDLTKAKNCIINSSTIETNTLLFADINCLKINKDVKLTCFNKLKMKNVNDFEMNNNSELSIQYSADNDNSVQECIIETNNLFYMDNRSNIYSTFKYFKIKSNNQIQIFGKIWLNESCKFQMYSTNQLLIAESGEITSLLTYVNKEKTKFLQQKTINKQDLMDNVHNNLPNEYYLHLYCDNIINIYGTIIGKKSLIIIDGNREINIFDNGRVNGGETYIRCMNNITFSGIIDNDCGDCFIVANNTLHLMENGRIFLLFLLFYGGNIIDECYSKTAANMSLDDVKKKLENITEKINNFETYKKEKLHEFSKKIKLKRSKKSFKMFDDEVNATIDKTGLPGDTIGQFLKEMNQLLFMTLQQQEHLILLDVKLSKFIELIDREFNCKLSMDTYFEDKNLSKFVSALKNEDLDELNKLVCKDENEFEKNILPLLTSIKMNLKEERELKSICLKPEIWKKYENEKEKLITQSVSEICPMLSLFFNDLNNAMQQTQTKALGNLNKNKSASSLAIQAIDATGSDAMKSLNIIAKYTKNDDIFKQNENVEKVICESLQEMFDNVENSILEKLSKIIFNYCCATENGILKLRALTFVTGIEECCSEIINNQQQMTESILLSKSILQKKPKTFKKKQKNKKNNKQSNKSQQKDNATTVKPKNQQNESGCDEVQKAQTIENLDEMNKHVEAKDSNDRSDISTTDINSCQNLLASWRLLQYHDKMRENGYEDPCDWYKLTKDYLKYHLNFKNGHIVRFKRKFNSWYEQFALSIDNKVGIELCKALLTNWRLIQYFDQIKEKGWEEPNDWILLTDDDLKNDLKFKRGHISRFKRKYTNWNNEKRKQLSAINTTYKTVATLKTKQGNREDNIRNKIPKRNTKPIDYDSIDSEQLWNVVEGGIEQILYSDINVIEISMTYFGFFGKFQASFEKFVQQENLLKRNLNKFKDWYSNNERTTNNNQESALARLTKEIAEFSNAKNEFSITISELKKIAIDCMDRIVKIMPNADTFKIAQVNRKRYQKIYLKKQQEYGNKMIELNDEYDTLFKQQLKLSAQQSTLQYEMEQRY